MRCQDGNSSDAKYLAINSGYALPPNVTSSENQMLVSFLSSDNWNQGYYALIHENPHYCEQWLDWESRNIRSPTFPDKKTKSRSCVWLLRANKGYNIGINIEHFQVICWYILGIIHFNGLDDLYMYRFCDILRE